MGCDVGTAQESRAVSSRLVLGTVQFGQRYGVANSGGRVSGEETAAILKHARAAGLDTLDTAIAYGEAEQRIGVGQWQVISKLPPVPDGCADVAAWVRDCVRGSLQRLKVAALHGLLLHRSQDLLGSSGAALSVALAATKSAGLVAKLGVSIYAPEELDDLASRMQLDVVQAPLSIVDRRLASSGWLARLHAAGTEVHVRSVFLQGLLLMDPGLRPARFARWQQLWDQWDRWLAEQALTPVQACISFALSQPGIDRVVVGVDSLQQLQEIIAGTTARSPAPPATLMNADLDLVNPSRWGAS